MDLYVKIPAIIIGLILLISLLQFFASIHPPRFKSSKTPDDYGLKYERVNFTTSDGLTLRGWWIPRKSNKTVIVTHGYPFDKGNVLSSTKFLNKHYNLLYFDFRYFGESDGSYTTAGYKEQKDFAAAVTFVKGKKKGPIGVLGFSLGAAVPLIENKGISAIVADSSYASLENMIDATFRPFLGFTKLPFVWITRGLARLFFGISISEVSPETSIKDAPAVLIIHGDRDDQIAVENAHTLYAASNKSKTELWIVEGANHGQAHHVTGDAYEKRVLDFFSTHLR